jgi:AcrR family transcriptional regulator
MKDVVNLEETPIEKAGRAGRARTPSRSRGIARFQVLLDATEALLAEGNPEDVGLHQIAEKAGVPAGSVYHFFPKREAALLALLERHQAHFDALYGLPIPGHELTSWDAILRALFLRAAQYYKSHPSAMKIVFSGYAWEIRDAGTRRIGSNSERIYSYLDKYFHMPALSDHASRFEICLTILHAVWGISFQRHGTITDVYLEEGLEASFAYCRLFLPPHIERR